MDSHEYAPGRTILSPEGEEYQVADTMLGSSGNDWLIVTQDRDLGPFTLLQAGHTRDTFFPVEPVAQEDTSAQGQAQIEAERKAQEKAKAKAQAKAQKKAKSKAAKKTDKGDKPKTAKKAKAKAAPSTPTVPGPAAVSK